jgi:hypothetical protein
MYLEIATLLEDALCDSALGYNEQLRLVERVKTFERPDPIVGVFGPWNRDTIAAESSDSLPTNSLIVMQVLEPVWDGEAAQSLRNTEEFQWLIMHATKVESPKQRWAQGSYAVRAILASLAAGLLAETDDERPRNRGDIAIQVCQRVTTDVMGNMPVADAHVNAVVALYFGVRDWKPIFTEG